MRRVLILGMILAFLSPVYGQMGPGGMMGGYGPGYGQGYGAWGNWTAPGPGYGLGPGMMGYWGNWSGGYGPGYGIGPGMTGYGGYGPGMTGYYHPRYRGTADTVLHYAFWLLLIAILAVVLYLLAVKKVCPRGGGATETLRERYARGEISEEEYKKMKATLEGR